METLLLLIAINTSMIINALCGIATTITQIVIVIAIIVAIVIVVITIIATLTNSHANIRQRGRTISK